jgi:hypothetical protein
VRLGRWVGVVSGSLCLILCSTALLAEAPSPTPPPATASPTRLPFPANAAELEALLSQKNYPELGQIFRNTNKIDEVVLNINWQRSKVLSGASAFMNFAYIADLDRIGTALGDVRGVEPKKMAAMILLYTYELILIDGVKCKDVSAPGHRKDQLLTNFPNVVKSIPTFSDEDLDTIIKTAIKIESFTAPRRADDDFLCRGGLAETQAALAKYGNEASREVPTPPGRLGKTMEIRTDPDYKPEFVGKETWEPKQAEFRASMPEILSKLVSGVRKK